MEYARKLSPTNYHILFLLVRFYNQIGESIKSPNVCMQIMLLKEKHVFLKVLWVFQTPSIPSWN